MERLGKIWRWCADVTLMAVLLWAWMLGWFNLLGQPEATWWATGIIFAPVWIAALATVACWAVEIWDWWKGRS